MKDTLILHQLAWKKLKRVLKSTKRSLKRPRKRRYDLDLFRLIPINTQVTDAADADKKAAEEAARLEESKKIVLKQDPSLPVAKKVQSIFNLKLKYSFSLGQD